MQRFRDQDKIKEYLDDLLSQRESEDLEFKQAAGGFPGSFWDTYSDFANTEGGTIILGVIEKMMVFTLTHSLMNSLRSIRRTFGVM